MTQCQFCGVTTDLAVGPHPQGPCPLRVTVQEAEDRRRDEQSAAYVETLNAQRDATTQAGLTSLDASELARMMKPIVEAMGGGDGS